MATKNHQKVNMSITRQVVLSVALAAIPLSGTAQQVVDEFAPSPTPSATTQQPVDEFAPEPTPLWSGADNGLGTLDNLLKSSEGSTWVVSPGNEGSELTQSNDGTDSPGDDSSASSDGMSTTDSANLDQSTSESPNFIDPFGGPGGEYSPEPSSPPGTEGPATDPTPPEFPFEDGGANTVDPTPTPAGPGNVDPQLPSDGEMLNQYIEQFKSDIVIDLNHLGNQKSSPSGSDAQTPK
jgi:hypothetical protein